MALPHERFCVAVTLAASLAAPPAVAAPVAPALHGLCGAFVVLDVDVQSIDDGVVTATVNAVFLQRSVVDADPGPPFADAAVGDEVRFEGCDDTGATRMLVKFSNAGSCIQAFAVDENGLVEYDSTRAITAEEAGSAAVSVVCVAALEEAASDEPREERPRSSGCSSTASDGSSWAACALALIAAVSKRNSSPARSTQNARAPLNA